MLRVLRSVLDDAGHPGDAAHVPRTVATLMDERAFLSRWQPTPGHADAAMTARLYLGRKGDLSRAAGVL